MNCEVNGIDNQEYGKYDKKWLKQNNSSEDSVSFSINSDKTKVSDSATKKVTKILGQFHKTG